MAGLRAETLGALEAVLDALEALEANSLLSDERFAKIFVCGRVARGLGPVRIKQELIQRGVASDTVTMQLEAFDEDWLEQVRDVCLKKFGAEAVKDAREKAKRVRYLQYRGFSMDIIMDVIENRECD